MQDPLIGRTLGQYLILSPIASGGMATVYRARQASLGREVAVKVLFRQYTSDATVAQRFETEGRIAAGLEHPNIIPIYDIGREGDLHYMAMRLLDGRTLKETVREGGAMPVPQCVEIISRIASALDYAHERGIIHRDLKPSNIFIERSGNPVLMDFGIAMVMGGSRLTHAGSLVGTPEYMSPEQATGKELDRRSDIYALGVVLYEMLSGRVPFESAGTPASVVVAHVSKPPPSVRGQANVPEAIEHVLLKALAKERDDRFASAGEFAAALKLAASQGRVPPEMGFLPPPESGAPRAPAARFRSTHQGMRVYPTPVATSMVDLGLVTPVAAQRSGLDGALDRLSLPLVIGAASAMTVLVLGVFAVALFVLPGRGNASAPPTPTVVTALPPTVPPTAEGASSPTATPVPRTPTAPPTPAVQVVVVTNTPAPTAASSATATTTPAPAPTHTAAAAAPTNTPAPAAPTAAPTPTPKPTDTPVPPPTNTPIPPTPASLAKAITSPIDGAEMVLVDVGSRKYYMDKYEVTNAQYMRYLQANPQAPAPEKWDNRIWPHYETPTFPALNITYEMAKSYAAWAGKRLPSDDEWQIAAQGSDGRVYPWGPQWDPNCANTSQKITEPVGSRGCGKSPFGTYDQSGNVWEWTASGAIRGGSWSNTHIECEVMRAYAPGSDVVRPQSIGFRTAMDAK